MGTVAFGMTWPTAESDSAKNAARMVKVRIVVDVAEPIYSHGIHSGFDSLEGWLKRGPKGSRESGRRASSRAGSGFHWLRMVLVIGPGEAWAQAE